MIDVVHISRINIRIIFMTKYFIPFQHILYVSIIWYPQFRGGFHPRCATKCT